VNRILFSIKNDHDDESMMMNRSGEVPILKILKWHQSSRSFINHFDNTAVTTTATVIHHLFNPNDNGTPDRHMDMTSNAIKIHSTPTPISYSLQCLPYIYCSHLSQISRDTTVKVHRGHGRSSTASRTV